jgi:hypothetical protein
VLAAEARVAPAVAFARLVGNGRSRSAFSWHGTCGPSCAQCCAFADAIHELTPETASFANRNYDSACLLERGARHSLCR